MYTRNKRGSNRRQLNRRYAQPRGHVIYDGTGAPCSGEDDRDGL